MTDPVLSAWLFGVALLAAPEPPGTIAAPPQTMILADTLAPLARRAPPLNDRWLGEDKLQHFTMSFSATAMTYGVARIAVAPDPALIAAAAVGGILGIGKEVVDARSGPGWSVKDLVWDAAGVALGLVLARNIR